MKRPYAQKKHGGRDRFRLGRKGLNPQSFLRRARLTRLAGDTLLAEIALLIKLSPALRNMVALDLAFERSLTDEYSLTAEHSLVGDSWYVTPLGDPRYADIVNARDDAYEALGEIIDEYCKERVSAASKNLHPGSI